MRLDELVGGGFDQRMNEAFEEVAQDIYDERTDPKATRKITATFTIKGSENRDMASMDIDVKVFRAPRRGISTTLLMGVEDDGSIVAKEYTREVPGQLDINGNEAGAKVTKIGELR